MTDPVPYTATARRCETCGGEGWMPEHQLIGNEIEGECDHCATPYRYGHWFSDECNRCPTCSGGWVVEPIEPEAVEIECICKTESCMCDASCVAGPYPPWAYPMIGDTVFWMLAMCNGPGVVAGLLSTDTDPIIIDHSMPGQGGRASVDYLTLVVDGDPNPERTVRQLQPPTTETT